MFFFIFGRNAHCTVRLLQTLPPSVRFATRCILLNIAMDWIADVSVYAQACICKTGVADHYAHSLRFIRFTVYICFVHLHNIQTIQHNIYCMFTFPNKHLFFSVNPWLSNEEHGCASMVEIFFIFENIKFQVNNIFWRIVACYWNTEFLFYFNKNMVQLWNKINRNSKIEYLKQIFISVQHLIPFRFIVCVFSKICSFIRILSY